MYTCILSQPSIVIKLNLIVNKSGASKAPKEGAEQIILHLQCNYEDAFAQILNQFNAKRLKRLHSHRPTLQCVARKCVPYLYVPFHLSDFSI